MFVPSPSPTLAPLVGCTSRRPYHAQPAPPLKPRTSSSRHEQRLSHRPSTTPSPRVRPTEPTASALSTTATSPRPLPSRSSQAVKRTADATTQYSPPGLPPTAKRSQVIDHRTGQVQDVGWSGAVAAAAAADTPQSSPRPSQASSSSRGGGAVEAGGGPEAGPLAGPSAPPQSRDGESNGRPKTAEQVLGGGSGDGGGGAEKTPGEARTRVKDVIKPSLSSASASSATAGGSGKDGHRKMDVEDGDESQEGQASSSKKARQEQPPVKMMPPQYEDCDEQELGLLIADMLLELVRHNDALPLKDRQLTRFHSRAPPGISIADYLNRLITHATLIPPLLLSMVFYIDRLCALYPVFTISSLTVHRFLITAATVAAKGLSDSFWTNNTYARVGGVTTRELALLELEFLEKMDWRIVPRPDVLRDYYRSLVERADGYELERRHPPAPSIQPQDAKTLEKKSDASQDTKME